MPPDLNRTPNLDLLVRVCSRLFAVLALFLTASACGANVDRIGKIADPEIKECSGIAASRQYPDVFWVHNDGKKDHLYAINRKGATLAEFKVKGAEFHDWEDIALDADNNLYAADTGNNDSKRTEVYVYRFREPDPKAAAKSVHVTRQWTLRYPIAPRDCESILVVGTNGYLISKVTGNKMAEVYSFPLEGPDGSIALKSLSRLVVDSPVTSAAVSPDGKTLAAISKEGAFFFDFDGTFLTTKLLRPKNRVVFVHQSIEGCTFVPDGLLVAAESRELFLFKIPGS